MMNENKLVRSDNQAIAGVCAGLAEYFGWDIALVRILYFILSVGSFGFPGTIIYIILWIVMPEKQNYI